MTVLLDASAVLAWLGDEPGADIVERHLEGGLMSAANWSEVLQKVRSAGGVAAELAVLLQAVGIEVVEVTADDGELAAELWSERGSLSLGDRLGLAVAARLGVRAVTADLAWVDATRRVEAIAIR